MAFLNITLKKFFTIWLLVGFTGRQFIRPTRKQVVSSTVFKKAI